MALKTVVDSIDDLAAEVQEHYKEKDGKFFLDILGIATHPEVKKLKEENGQRRITEKAATDKLATYTAVLGERTPEQIQADLDRIQELEAAAGGKLDEGKINGIVESRIKVRLAPVERERDQLKADNEKLAGERDGLIQNNRRRSILDSVRTAAVGAKLLDTAVEDALLLAERVFDIDEDGVVTVKDNVGATPGVSPEVWLKEMQDKRPHWWGASAGGGATGGKGGGAIGPNPFSNEGWNMTEQGRLINENRNRAEQLAKSAGTTIGGPKPPPKK